MLAEYLLSGHAGSLGDIELQRGASRSKSGWLKDRQYRPLQCWLLIGLIHEVGRRLRICLTA